MRDSCSPTQYHISQEHQYTVQEISRQTHTALMLAGMNVSHSNLPNLSCVHTVEPQQKVFLLVMP